MVLYKMKKSVKAINISGLGKYTFLLRGFCVKTPPTGSGFSTVAIR
jgi:hypothetical protein